MWSTRTWQAGFESSLAAALLASLLALGAGPATGQTIDTRLWGVTDAGGVNDIARAGNTIYVSGNFRQVGPCTGRGIAVSASTGRPADEHPRIAGVVSAATSDGRGGWFVGGSFVSVSGLERHYLAHVLADGSLSAWDPRPNAPVAALTLSRDTLYVGGAFTTCGGTNRQHGAAFDARTGRLTNWDPGPNGPISAITTDGALVYLGGSFSALGTMPRGNLAAVDRTIGAPTAWNPEADSVVLALAVRGDEVYAGGYFRHVGDAPRSLLAAIDRATGDVLPWSWAIDRTPACNLCDAAPCVSALAVSGSRLYVGGSFTHVDGVARSGAASIALSSHALDNWDPQLFGVGPLPSCRAIAVHKGVVYLGGKFDGLKGIARAYAGAVDTNGVLSEWTPNPNASVSCVAAAGTTTYIGGEFVSTWGWKPRRFLAAFDATTGEVLPWDPSPNNVVGQIRVSGNTVYVAGAFETIAGQPRTCLAAIDTRTGQATPWNPGIDAGIYPPVRDMIVHDGVVYVAGLFSGLGGEPRYCLGAVDSATGRATNWNPHVDDFVEAIAILGDTLYLGGWFSRVNGLPRDYLAAVDTRGTVLDWNPGPNSIVQSMAIAEGRVFIGGGFTSVGGLPRSTLAAIDCATGTVTDWIVDAEPQVRCLAAANGVLYAGGWFRQVGGEVRNGLAAIDAQTGALLPWDPRPSLPNAIWAIRADDDALYVGGSFEYLGRERRPGLAAISLARGGDPGPFPIPGSNLAVAQNAPNPARVSTTIRFGLSTAAPVTLAVFDLAGRCMVRPLKNEVRSAGSHVVELRTSDWPSGVYYYRFETDGVSAARKMVVVR